MYHTLLRLLLLLSLVMVSGCGDGLFYGESTSFDLAAIRVNEDPAQPIKVNVGLSRNVATVAPPLGEQKTTPETTAASKPAGESVSQFSSFTVNAQTPFVQAGVFETTIQSRFASGAAAIAVAEKPAVAGALMGLRPFTELTEGDKDLLKKLSSCVNSMDRAGLDQVANTLSISFSDSQQQNDLEAKRAITGLFLSSDPIRLKGYAATLKGPCPT